MNIFRPVNLDSGSATSQAPKRKSLLTTTDPPPNKISKVGPGSIQVESLSQERLSAPIEPFVDSEKQKIGSNGTTEICNTSNEKLCDSNGISVKIEPLNLEENPSENKEEFENENLVIDDPTIENNVEGENLTAPQSDVSVNEKEHENQTSSTSNTKLHSIETSSGAIFWVPLMKEALLRSEKGELTCQQICDQIDSSHPQYNFNKNKKSYNRFVAQVKRRLNNLAWFKWSNNQAGSKALWRFDDSRSKERKLCGTCEGCQRQCGQVWTQKQLFSVNFCT